MSNWRYFQATGQAGGTTALQYVDSFNGDDANPGTYLLPKQSIQGAFDAGATNMTIVLAGYFNEGDFVGIPTTIFAIYTEGDVILDGLGFTSMVIQHFADNIQAGVNPIYNFGKLIIKNFSGDVFLVSRNNSASGKPTLNNIDFIGLDFVKLLFIVRGTFSVLKNCFFKDCNVFASGINNVMPNTLIENNTFVNTSFERGNSNVSNIDILKNNTLVGSSKLDISTPTSNLILDYNCILGTAGNGQKIRVNNVWYENTEALQLATSFAQNDLPSTTDPKFNLINPFDYTLQADSPLARAGKGNIYIGAYGVAKATPSNDVVWTATGIDNTTNPDEAVLTASPTGTLESTLIEISDKVRRVTRINMPDFEIAPSLGETIGRLASDRTPYNVSVEIQYSTDGVTTNGTWLQVPVGTQPFHDTVNDVGNDSATFDMANATAIFASHLQYRVTMRDNEVAV
jgi:hypothetical protein